MKDSYQRRANEISTMGSGSTGVDLGKRIRAMFVIKGRQENELF
jgi:hypothetical protein